MQTLDISSGGDGRATAFNAPKWVDRLFPGSTVNARPSDNRRVSIDVEQNCEFSRIFVRASQAANATAVELEGLTSEAYGAIVKHLAASPTPHPIRFWNAIPRINEPTGPKADRYMAFNAGRFTAFERWYGDRSRFGEVIATASGVGHDGEDLLIYCLASSTPGIPLENPRQIPAYRYSARYGLLPPSFARATIHRAAGTGIPLLLIGGTASICGEHSKHDGDLDAQLCETIANLEALVGSAQAAINSVDSTASCDDASFQSLRVYYRNTADRSRIERAVNEKFAGHVEVEWRQASLCRPELLVEIEGVAGLASASRPESCP